ncbi:ZZ-type zinc finger-containing protein 3 [Diachasma alloeum]|uniref:ZZ-type zinc finger-containing protein 3 n=1 Tax=Diachasma alloeum TaxID=454923 RepID=UPI0007382A39|nr:ZZ-type zinc finger-containing protein 3 [Diachasma alloeum]
MDSEDDNNEFYFESDHLALKGNKDYMSLLQTIVMLEAQRTQAIRDLDTLLSFRAKAMKDPISFVSELQNGNLPELPGRHKIPEIPYIDWSAYNITGPNSRIKPQTRHGNVIPQVQVKSESDDGKILVRGRAFDESKPETFNQLWTAEEQRRLEELLIEYPPEEVEMKRWTKIANALGNRTPKQVSSRVQKYFIKLLKAGLPIPGRGPKVKTDFKKGLHHRNLKGLLRRSTFFPHQDFNDYEEREETRSHPSITTEDSEDDAGPSTGSEETSELRQIQLLKRIKTEKEEQGPLYQHFGYKCSICDEEPLKGTRWHCTECPDVDLCSDCAVAQMEAVNPVHTPLHRLTDIRPPECSRNYDKDYLPQNFDDSSCYNYLDPNFLPG